MYFSAPAYFHLVPAHFVYSGDGTVGAPTARGYGGSKVKASAFKNLQFFLQKYPNFRFLSILEKLMLLKHGMKISTSAGTHD